MESVNQGVDRRGFIQGAGAVAAATAVPAMAAQKKNEAMAVDGYAWAEQIRRGDITPLEALEAAIARTQALPKLNAVVIKDYDLARDQARQMSALGSAARAEPRPGRPCGECPSCSRI